LLALTSSGQAATTTFKADLKGASEVPANTTSGSGTATVTLDPDTRKITWNVTFSGLTGPATAAHIHGPAPAGKNAGVLVWLSTKGKEPTSPLSGSTTLTEAQASDLASATSTCTPRPIRAAKSAASSRSHSRAGSLRPHQPQACF
jgi:hypothetical protein